MKARALKPGEIRRIVAALPKDDALWFEIGCETGLRISEILSLTWNDLCEDRPEGPPTRAQASPRVFLEKERMKGRKHGRIVWLPRKTQNSIERRIPSSGIWDPESKVFPISRTTAWRRIKKIFGTLGISPHSLRKTFATKTYRKLHDVLLTSIVLGHIDWKNTLKYIEGMGEADLWHKLQVRNAPRPKARVTKIGYRRPPKHRKK